MTNNLSIYHTVGTHCSSVLYQVRSRRSWCVYIILVLWHHESGGAHLAEIPLSPFGLMIGLTSSWLQLGWSRPNRRLAFLPPSPSSSNTRAYTVMMTLDRYSGEIWRVIHRRVWRRVSPLSVWKKLELLAEERVESWRHPDNCTRYRTRVHQHCEGEEGG